MAAASTSSAEPSLRADWDVEQSRLTALIRDDWAYPPDIAAFAAGAVEISGPPESGALPADSATTAEPDCSSDPQTWLTVAGLDISFVKDSTDACACMSILARESLEPIAHVIKRVTMTVPYIPGYLAFREAPLLLGLVSTWQTLVDSGLPESVGTTLSTRKASRKGTIKDTCSFETDQKYEVHLVEGWRGRISRLNGVKSGTGPGHACSALPELPAVDVLLVDGNGYHHPRRCGAAVAVGVECGLPTIGVGKELHAFAQLQRDDVVARAMAGLTKQGQWMLLHCPVNKPGSDTASSGSLWDVTGAAMLSGKSAKKPIYISVGNRMNLRCACAVTASLVRHRVPEPVRQADLFSRQWLREQEAAEAKGSSP